MNERDAQYLDHMLDCLDKVVECCKGDRQRFEKDYVVMNAALHLLQLLAQSAKRLSPEAVIRLESVDVARIIGFRNILVHEYLGGIDYDVVWNVIVNELPPLRAAIIKAKGK